MVVLKCAQKLLIVVSALRGACFSSARSPTGPALQSPDAPGGQGASRPVPRQRARLGGFVFGPDVDVLFRVSFLGFVNARSGRGSEEPPLIGS